MKINIVLCGYFVASSVACDPPTREETRVPSPEGIRLFMGLVDGNCWRYKLGGSGTYLNMSASGPNMVALAGRSLHVRTWLSDSGDQFKEEYYDTSISGRLHLARQIDGRGSKAEVRTYDAEPLPLVGEFDYSEMNQIQFAQSVFETTATPMNMMAEDYQWTVINPESTGTKHDGMSSAAVEFSSKRGNESPSRYTLVPGYGYTKYTDSEGRSYQVCDACVSDTDGACSEEQCSALKNCD